MNRLKTVIILANALALTNCIAEKESEKPEALEYENILIYSDLSNRLNKVPNDTMVINQIVNYFWRDCVKPGIKVNDRSSISFSRVNFYNSACSSARIDLGEITSLQQKQLFVNNKSRGKNLAQEVSNFKKVVQCNYLERDKGGLDIISLINKEIDGSGHIKKPAIIAGEGDTTIMNYHNHLFVFTDGYLEFSKEAGNDKFYFGPSEIDKVRKYCLLNKIGPSDALKMNPDFKLEPIKSSSNRYVNLYVMETSDRGLNEQNGTLKYAGDLSDNNILKTVWEVWASESGFSHFVWKQITKPTSLQTDYIKSLMVN